MRKNKPAQIQEIVDGVLPGLLSGETTLDAILSEHADQAEFLRPHLESALWLVSHQPELDPRPGYISSSQQRLVSNLKTQKPPRLWEHISQRYLLRRLAIQSISLVFLVLSLALVANNLVMASRLTLPGDWLYPAKLNIEQLQLAMTIDPQAQARLQIEFTQRRTTEIVQMVLEDDTIHLPASAERLESQINHTVVDLERARVEDETKAEELILSMQAMLENEAFILKLLRDMQPAFADAGLNQAIEVTNSGLDALQN